MTVKQVFEYALIELNKVQAPSLLLEDYNYFINKAINQYINKIYNGYEVNQQKSDDLRVLKGTTVLPVKLQTSYPNITGVSPNQISNNKLFGATYETYLPDDYLHILNCVAEYKVKKAYKCYDANNIVHFGVKRLTSDMFSQIINNHYMRPTYKYPYFFINNVNVSNSFPTTDNQIKVVSGFKIDLQATKSGTLTITKNESTLVLNYDTIDTATSFSTPSQLVTDLKTYLFLSNEEVFELDSSVYISNVNNVVSTDNITVTNSTHSLVNKLEEERYGNKSKVRIEIRYGKDNTLFELQQIYVDYLKSPQFIRLTQDDIDEVEDNTAIIEFPDYVCQEIVNELIKLLMENGSDPRLQSHIPVNQSIAQPQQEQQPKR